MEPNELDAAVKTAVADALAKYTAEQKAEADKAAALKTAEEAKYQEGYTKAVEDLKNRRMPTYHTTQKSSDSDEGVGAFKHWLATGQENGELITPDASYNTIPDGKAAWNVTTGGSGGYAVPDPLYSQIQAKRNLASWVRQAPVQHFETPSDHLLVPREDTSHTAFVLTAEAAAYDENEGTISQKDLILYKYTKMEKMSEEFVNYQQTNFEAWLTSALSRAEAVTENTIFTNGNGTGQPEGAAYGATASGIAIKTSAQLNPEDLTSIIGKLGGGWNVPSECGFVLANASKWYLKNAILAGPFAFASNNGNQGAPDFFGYNSFVSDDMPAYTSTTGTDKVLLFGNFTGYGVVEKPGMIVQRNPYLYMANGQIAIFASIFRGGGVLQAEALYYHVAK
jgi:HK97 family phage major capsid protein